MVCVVRGSGDIGSAVGHALFSAGHPVVIHDVPMPANPRRGRAFLDALFDGHSSLEGIGARRVDDFASLRQALDAGNTVTITAMPFESLIDRIRPSLLVDARMRKREVPESQMALAPLTIGLGPNFVAGETTHLVVETAWGEDLGRVIVSGPSAAFTGIPRLVMGHGRGRYVHAPAAGRFESSAVLGIRVSRGDGIGRIGTFPIGAPLDGTLVGLTRPGVDVVRGAKILEVDPRGDSSLAFGIGERARSVAAGVLRAVEAGSAVALPGNVISIMTRRASISRS